MKTALALSGSYERLPFLQAVKNLGHRLLVIDADLDAPGLALADEIGCFPISDRTQLTAFVKAFDIDYLVPLPLGRMLIHAGYLNDWLGLGGVSEHTADICTDKVALNRCLQKTSVSQAKQHLVKDATSFQQALADLGYPCVIKPRFGSGSREVQVLMSVHDAEIWLSAHSKTPLDVLPEDFLLENLLPGRELGVDGLVEAGDLKWLFLREKKLMPLPDCIVHQYLAPVSLNATVTLTLQKVLQTLCEAVGFRQGLFHADMRMEPGGDVHLIEFAPRPAGFLIYDQIIAPAMDDTVLDILMKQAAGLPYVLPAPVYAVALSYFPFSGRVQYVPDPQDLVQRYPALFHFAPRFTQGQYLPVLKTGADLIARGYVSFRDPEVSVVVEQLQALLSDLKRYVV